MDDSHAVPGGFPQPPVLLRWKPMAQAWYLGKSKYRSVRILPLITRMLGPQYRRSRDRIEIDITYRCNLRCMNCNRSIARAPENLDISLDMIAEFIDSSLQRAIGWKKIRLLGGEPTLHPHFLKIVEMLREYRARGNRCSIEVVTNGYGSFVNQLIKRLPADIWIENSHKRPGVQEYFRPFSAAPIDDANYSSASFVNGCEIMSVCGMGLTPLGYYPCALSGGIDRIVGLQMGRTVLPDRSDDMTDILEETCCLCGRFKDGHHLPKEMVSRLPQELVSPSWEYLYSNWRQIKGRADVSG